jgi:hypothetical protein
MAMAPTTEHTNEAKHAPTHLMLQDVDQLSQRVHVSQLHKAWPQQVIQQLPQRLQQRPQCLTQTWCACRAEEEEGLHGVFKRLSGNGHQLRKDAQCLQGSICRKSMACV